MAEVTWKNAIIPTPGDDLLGAWATFNDSIGSIIAVPSIAAARLLLDKAEAQGQVISASKPVYFRVGGVQPGMFYECVGKSTQNVWVLTPFNQVEYTRQHRTGVSQSVTLAAGQESVGFTSPLPARPYDRLVTAWASAHYVWNTGSTDIVIRINGAVSKAHLDSNTSESQSVFGMGVVPAGETPNIQLLTVGGGGGGGKHTWNLTDATQNYFYVQAVPVAMS